MFNPEHCLNYFDLYPVALHWLNKYQLGSDFCAWLCARGWVHAQRRQPPTEHGWTATLLWLRWRLESMQNSNRHSLCTSAFRLWITQNHLLKVPLPESYLRSGSGFNASYKSNFWGKEAKLMPLILGIIVIHRMQNSLFSRGLYFSKPSSYHTAPVWSFPLLHCSKVDTWTQRSFSTMK